MKSNHLKGHYETKHMDFGGTLIDLKRMEAEFLKTNEESDDSTRLKQQITNFSYRTSYLLAKQGLPHTTAENIVKPILFARTFRCNLQSTNM